MKPETDFLYQELTVTTAPKLHGFQVLVDLCVVCSGVDSVTKWTNFYAHQTDTT